MTRELLFTIKTVGTEAPYAGKPVSPVRFEDGYFNPPKTTLISKTLRWARESLGSLLAVGRIFININKYGYIAHYDSNIVLKEIYKRDWSKMEEAGQEIANKKFALSVGGGRNEPIRSKTYKKMTDIITKYQDSGLLSKDSTMTLGVTYSQILGMLENLNILAKHQIVEPNSNQLTNNVGSDGLLIKIRDTAVASISDAYKCVADRACQSNQVITDLKKIVESTKDNGAGWRSSVANTSKRLADAMVGIVKDTIQGTKSIFKKEAEEVGMSEDQYRILKSRYGLSTKQMKEAGLLGYKNDRRRSQRQTVKQGFTNMVGVDNIKEKIKDLVMTSKNITTGNPEEKSFKITMITSANDIIDEAAEQRDYVMIAQNADVLTRFGLLSTQLTTLEDAVGNNSDGLIKTLGDSCENQCSNITSKKCFY